MRSSRPTPSLMAFPYNYGPPKHNQAWVDHLIATGVLLAARDNDCGLLERHRIHRSRRPRRRGSGPGTPRGRLGLHVSVVRHACQRPASNSKFIPRTDGG